METCIVFGAAEFDEPAAPISGFVIAADGGLRHTRHLGIAPDLILGDFDSLGYVPPQAEVFPVEKDDTDTMLAIKAGLSKGCRRFYLYGSMDGPRIDHTVANLQALRYLAERDCLGLLVGKEYCAAAVKNGALEFSGTPEGGVSVFCMGDTARGVTLTGLYYGLTKGELTGSFPLGVSNHFTGSLARIQVEQGCLLVIWQRCAGMPEKGEIDHG